MKKLLFSLLAISMFNSAYAACQVFSCGGADSINASASGYGNQCFYCNDNYAGDKQCKDGDVVGQVDPQGRITNLVQCQVTTFNDYWNDFNPSVFCPNSDIQFGNPDGTFPNSYKSYSLDNGNKTIGYVSGDDTVLKAGNTACVYIKCNSGYMPNAAKTECIADNREQRCVDSGGTWTGSACTCDSAKNLRVENNVCVCLDDVNYVRNGDRCDLTDAAALQQKCTSQASIASGAYWDDVNKQCRCTNQQYSWNGSVCAMNPAIQKCLLITGANWNYTTGQCYCMEVGKTFNPEGTACVDATTSGGSASSTTTVTTDQQAAARERIESTVSKLDDIASGLKLTVWRNEEGNFNTSRLLSDSIAGVVLGTAGGLITSNVVKKNQVENGFEDIQCTIGGQVVAGWGDEFRVGIQ